MEVSVPYCVTSEVDVVHDDDTREPPTEDVTHLDAGLLAGFLDHALDAEERERVEAHLDECRACRKELHEAGLLKDSAPKVASRRTRPSRSARWGAMVGALAASVVALMISREVTRPTRAVAVERAATAPEGGVRINVVSPLGTEPRASASIVFVWRSASRDVYRFVLLSESGESLYTTETADTSITWPSQVTPTPGSLYFWRVDGVGGAEVASTGAQRLRLSP